MSTNLIFNRKFLPQVLIGPSTEIHDHVGALEGLGLLLLSSLLLIIIYLFPDSQI